MQGNLTEQEKKIVTALCNGMTNAEVAAAMELSPRTVETYRMRIMDKLGLKHVAQLVKYAIRAGLTKLEEETAEAAPG